MNLNNKSGITLVELLAAIVLFGIVASLVAVILSLVTRITQDIQVSNMANSEGLYLKTAINSELIQIDIRSVNECSPVNSSCVIIRSEKFYASESFSELEKMIRIDLSNNTLSINVFERNYQDGEWLENIDNQIRSFTYEINGNFDLSVMINRSNPLVISLILTPISEPTRLFSYDIRKFY